LSGDFDGGGESFDGATDSGNSDLAATGNGLAADQPAPDQAQGIDPPPTSWPAKRRDRWSSLSAEDRAFIAARERDAHTKISQQGEELARLRALAPLEKWLDQFPADMPREEALRHLEQSFGQGDAAKHMRQLAQEYQQNYEPLKSVLDQYQDAFEHYGRPPHETLNMLLAMERQLRTDPSAIAEVAKAYGYELPAAEHVTTLQQQLYQAQQREHERTFQEFAKDKPYLRDDQMVAALAGQMREQQQQIPGLKGEALLKLAHDNLAERTGIAKHLEQQREQAMQQALAARDAEWQQLLAQREAEWAKRETELVVQRQRYAEEHARKARRAASVNVKSSPGHGTNPKTVDDTLREIATRCYNGG
jgi:hypothetical protein